MPWTLELPWPIAFNDGRRLVTLANVRSLIVGLPGPHRDSEHWQRASDLLLVAASAEKPKLAELEEQLTLALAAEGLI